MNQGYVYDAFYDLNPKGMDCHAPRLRWMYRQAKRNVNGSRCLNIGIGNGYLEGLLYGKGWLVSSIDIAPKTVERMRGTGVDARFASIDSIPYMPDTFDTVFCGEILEHLDDDTRNRGIAEMMRVLKPGGTLIGSVPLNERLVDNTVPCPYCSKTFHIWGHRKSYTADGIVEELGRAGFKAVETYRSAFLNFQTQGMIGKIALFPFWVLGRIGRGFAPINCGFVAKKASAPEDSPVE